MGQAFGKAVFHGEIGDQLAVVNGRERHVGIEFFAGLVVHDNEARVGGRLFESGLGDLAKHAHSVVRGTAPFRGVQAAEHATQGAVPNP